MAIRIDRNKLLVVEGNDEKNFFECYLNYLQIDNIQIISLGGTPKYKEQIPAIISATGFNPLVEIFAIIRDAETNENAAFQSIQHIINSLHLRPPDENYSFSNGTPKVGIYILPGNHENGMCEDLLLKTVENHPAMVCVNDFMKCVNKLDDPPRIQSKAKAKAFLAAMPESVPHIGIAALKKYWNFDSECLSSLKQFLQSFK